MAEFPSVLTKASFLCAGTNAKIRPKATTSTAVPMIAMRAAAHVSLASFSASLPPLLYVRHA